MKSFHDYLLNLLFHNYFSYNYIEKNIFLQYKCSKIYNEIYKNRKYIIKIYVGKNNIVNNFFLY